MKLMAKCTVLLTALIVPLWAQQDNLTQEFAAARAQQVSEVSYHLYFDFIPGQKTFKGVATLDLTLKKPGDLTIDFSGKAINKLLVNQKPVANFVFQPEAGRITIPGTHLQPGRATVTLDYEGSYSHEGQGLHQYIDPSDNREYLYTHLEPNDAHRVFPCFDQPDLRAPFTFEVLAPSDWVIVSNGALSKSTPKDGRTLSTFKKTKPFSTYITQLTAGPYAVFADASFRYPLRVLCRQSLAGYLDHAYFLESTRKSFDFLESYFDYPYPFEKYDQIFCPEYNIGAMENVAAVTWNDDYITPTPLTQDQILNRDLTLYHEMAHMWFGDLVTMKWWNDLWLKESFATYISYLAMEGIGIKDVWTRSLSSKQWALNADQVGSTHPILAQVKDIRAASSIFDGITYGKGFAVLRQLDHYLGEGGFRAGCRAYFKKHEWQAVTLQEFMAAMEEAVGKDLDSWSQLWLGERGVNTLHLEFQNLHGNIQNARIRQDPSTFNDILRPHTTDIGLYDQAKTGLVLRESLRVTYNGSSTPLPQLDGKPVPAFVLPNHTDIDFVKVVFDAHSTNWLKENIATLTQLDVKNQSWRHLWEMLHDGHFSLASYMDLALAQIAKETDSMNLATLKENLLKGTNSYIPEPSVADSYRQRLFDIARKRLNETANNSPELQQVFFELMNSTASRPEDFTYVKDLLDGKETIPGYPLDTFRAWELLTTYGRVHFDDASQRAIAFDKKNPSARGKEGLLQLAASNPDPKVKAEYWQKVAISRELPLTEAFAIARGLFPRNQAALQQPYIETFFTSLPDVYREREYAFVHRFVSQLFPSSGLETTLKHADTFIARKDIDMTLRNLVVTERDTLARTLAIRGAWSHR